MAAPVVQAARAARDVRIRSKIAGSLYADLRALPPDVWRPILRDSTVADKQQILAIAQHEEGTPYALWRESVVGFIEDVLGEQTWSVPNRFLDAIPFNSRVAVPSAFSTSKTWSIARSVLWHSCVYPVGTARVVTIAAKWSQVIGVIWPEVRHAHARAGLPGKPDVAQWRMTDAHGVDFVVANGIAAAAHNEAAVQGLHASKLLLVVDEAGGIAPRVGRNLRALLSAKGTRMVAIGNPPSDNEGSWFEQLCEEDGVLVFPVPAYSTPNFTGQDLHLRCLSCPPEVDAHPLAEHLASKEAVAETIALHGKDSPYVQAKVYARFPKGGSARAIPSGWVDAAVEGTDIDWGLDRLLDEDLLPLGSLLPPDDPEAEVERLVGKGDWIRLGVDIAADGGDEFVIGRCVGTLMSVRHISSGAVNANPTDVAGVVLAEIRRAEALRAVLGTTAKVRVKVDAIGVGWGVVGILNAWASEGIHDAEIVGIVVSESVEERKVTDTSTLRPYRKRDEMWLATRVLLQPNSVSGVGSLRLMIDNKTKSQLTTSNYGTSSLGKTIIESKRSLTARGVSSPDRAEALLLTAYEGVPKKRKGGLLI